MTITLTLKCVEREAADPLSVPLELARTCGCDPPLVQYSFTARPPPDAPITPYLKKLASLGFKHVGSIVPQTNRKDPIWSIFDNEGRSTVVADSRVHVFLVSLLVAAEWALDRGTLGHEGSSAVIFERSGRFLHRAKMPAQGTKLLAVVDSRGLPFEREFKEAEAFVPIGQLLQAGESFAKVWRR